MGTLALFRSHTSELAGADPPGNSFTALRDVVNSEQHTIIISKYANYILSGSGPMDFLLFAHSFQYF